MFNHHNKYTKISYWILGGSSLVGFAFIGILLSSLTDAQPLLVYGISALLSSMLILNTYFAYRIFKKSTKALRLSLWLYGLQIIGFESENWELSLNFGMNVSVTWSYGTTNITFNLLAIIIFLVVFKALKSVKNSKPQLNIATS